MDKTTLINMALDELNMPRTTAEQLGLPETDPDGGPTKDPLLTRIESRLSEAATRVCTQFEWSWTERLVTFTADDDCGPEAGYGHSYELPVPLIRVTHVPAEEYMTIGGKLLCSDPVEWIAVQDMDSAMDFEDKTVPLTYWAVVARTLALIVLPFTTNSSQQLETQITQRLSMQLNELALMDANTNVRRLV